MNKMISVNDKLPEIGKRVIVRYLYSLDYHDPKADWISVGSIDYYSNYWRVDTQCALSNFVVTHWFPLPSFDEIKHL